VVFIDDGPWISFNQMAARMRRTDCHTLRITCDQSWASRWPGILLYDRFVVVTSWADPPRLDDLVRGGEVVDIQCAEPLLAAAEALARDSTVVTAAARERLRARLEFGDKLCAMDRLSAAGVRVPSHLAGSTTPIDPAVEALGLPIVVKPRRGAAGDGVVVARDAVVARQAVAGALAAEDALFEKFIAGKQLSFCAVFLDGAVRQDAVYERVRADNASLGLLGSLRTRDDKPIFDLGGKAVAAIGGSGLVDLDILLDCDGNAWVIDVNLRAWHSLGALLEAGVDFTEGYLGVLGLTSGPPRRQRATPGVEIRLSLLLEGGRTGRRWWPAIAWFVAASRRRITTFGARYWVSELLTYASGRLAALSRRRER
jgi:ATP-grasp domain